MTKKGGREHDADPEFSSVPSQSSRRGRRLDMRSVSPRTIKMSSVYGSLMDCVAGDRLHEARSSANPSRWMVDDETVQRLQPPSVRTLELEALNTKLTRFMEHTQRRFDLVSSELSAVKSAQIAVMANRARSLSTDKPAFIETSSSRDMSSEQARILFDEKPTTKGASTRNDVNATDVLSSPHAVQHSGQELQQITSESQLLPQAPSSTFSSGLDTALEEAVVAIEDLSQRLTDAEERIMEQMDANEQWKKEIEIFQSFRENASEEFSAMQRQNVDLKMSVAMDMLNLARGTVKHKTSLRTSPWISEGDRRSQRPSAGSERRSRLRSELRSHFAAGSSDRQSQLAGVTPRSRFSGESAASGATEAQTEFGRNPDTSGVFDGAIGGENDGDVASVARETLQSNTGLLIGQDLERVYSLKDTVWDAALLLGFESVGFVANLTLAMSLVCNITLQLLFCWIVTSLPEDDEYEGTQEAINTWLATASAADVRGVCDADQSMSGNYQQYSLFDTARGYVREFSPGVPYAQGPILCCIVLIAWSLSICVVLREVIDFVSCMTVLCDREVECIQIVSSLQRFHLQAVPVHRMIWAWTLGFVQASIAVILLWYGAKWLVTTTSPSELVLNAVALTYVMEIDELIFQAIVPKQVSVIISNLDPLALFSGRPRFLHEEIPFRAITSAFVIFIFVVIFSTTFLEDHHAHVQAVARSLDCDNPV